MNFDFKVFAGEEIGMKSVWSFGVWQTPPHLTEPLIEIRKTDTFINLNGEVIQGSMDLNDLVILQNWIKENKIKIEQLFNGEIEEI